MLDEKRETLIEKIRKIHRKAESTSSEAEANTFLEKMSKMMEENSITMEELMAQDRKNGFGNTIFDLQYGDQWRRGLMFSVAKLCGCVGLHLVGGSGTMKAPMQIWGRPENVEIAIDTYLYIHGQVRVIARSLYPGDTKKYRQAQTGIAWGVCEKIKQIQDEMMKSAVEGAINTKVPMVVEARVVKEFMYSQVKTKPMKNRAIKVSDATYRGMDNAGRVDVRKVVR